MYNFNAVTRAYLTQTIDFVRRLVFKSEQVARSQNAYLTSMGYVVTEDLAQWKYYLNLNGQYHESDAIVTVLSSDTGERIPFTKAGLVGHPLTQQDYSPGGERHSELMTNNPEHRGWLDRVMAPVDIQAAIDAKNYQILSYDADAIAVNETSFLSRLQEWLYGWELRWHEYQMAYREELHSAAERHVLLNSMTLAILTLRNEQARTTEVDDFHLWAYLGSRYSIDRFRNHLSKDQALWLYRNMEYLRFHVGKEATFELLLKHLAEPANIRANRFDLMYLFRQFQNQQSVTPTVMVNPYASEKVDYGFMERETPEYALTLTRYNTERNDLEFEKDLQILTDEMQSLPYRIVPTGQVQMTYNRSTGETYFNSFYARIAQWLYLANQGTMRITHDIQTVAMGRLSLTSREAAILFQYCAARITGITPYLPQSFDLWRVRHTILENGDQLNRLVGEEVAERIGLEAFKQTYTPIAGIFSSEEFDSHIEQYSELYLTLLGQKFQNHNPSTRTDIENAKTLAFRPTSISLILDEPNYASWLEAQGIMVTGLSEAEFADTMLDILRDVVGLSLDNDGSSAKHKAIMAIIKLFTPYSVVFTADGDLPVPIPYSYSAYTPYDFESEVRSDSFRAVASLQTEARYTLSDMYEHSHPTTRSLVPATANISYHATLLKFHGEANTRPEFFREGNALGRTVSITPL